jgi:polysaccharide pyruvyl transferase CsaB
MKVVVSGYYGFGNAGDEALLEGLLDGLRSAGHHPLVLSADPAATERLHRVPSRHRVRGLLPALLGCHALVSGGGGLLQDKSSARSLRYYLGVLRLARLLGRRAVVYGQSVGPLSPAGRSAVSRTLRGIPVAVRDQASRELLAGLGVAASLTADSALLLDPPQTIEDAASEAGPVATPKAIPNALSGEPAGGSASRAASVLADRRSEVVLVPRSGHPELGDGLAVLGRHFLGSDRPVALLALHHGEDDPEVSRLAALLPEARILAAADHRQALTIVARAGLVVSARLHGLILAAAAGTPFLGLVYDPKVAGFLADAGGVGFSPPLDHARLLEAACASRALPAATRERLRERAAEGLSWLDRALRGVA